MSQSGNGPDRLVWTLSKAYGCQRVDTVKALRALLSNAAVALESAAAVG